MKRSLERLYHAAPLHYVPSIVAAGALYAQSVLQSAGSAAPLAHSDGRGAGGEGVPSGISPRRTAFRRDRMLGLDDYVHLSPSSPTPLLVDKMDRGYPHAVLVFRGDCVLALPEVAVLPYNTKAWRTRFASGPATDPVERDVLLRRYLTTSRLPSLEILVKYGLPLDCLEQVSFFNDDERDWVTGILDAAGCSVRPLTVDQTPFPRLDRYEPRHSDIFERYAEECRPSRSVLPPPSIEFD